MHTQLKILLNEMLRQLKRNLSKSPKIIAVSKTFKIKQFQPLNAYLHYGEIKVRSREKWHL